MSTTSASMKVSRACFDLLTHTEGLELEAYPDPESELGRACGANGFHVRNYRKVLGWQNMDPKPWTIGYGTTSATGHKVFQGLKIDEATAVLWRQESVDRTAVEVQKLVTVPLKQQQLDALTSLVYNIGIFNFSKSTVLRLLNAGEHHAAADEFARWRMSNGKISKGLEARRIEERKLFLSGNEAEVKEKSE